MSGNTKICHPCKMLKLKLCISLNTQRDRYCVLTYANTLYLLAFEFFVKRGITFGCLFFFSFLTLFSLSLSTIQPSLPRKLHLICFPLFCFLSSHHPAPVFPSRALCQLKTALSNPGWTDADTEWKKNNKSARLYGPDPHLPLRLAVILSRDLLPTRPRWIPAICSTALAFKCLIEPLISWTVAVCV